ncbi:hypothetical protein D3C83_240860 [compost metagenome]
MEIGIEGLALRFNRFQAETSKRVLELLVDEIQPTQHVLARGFVGPGVADG